MQGRLGSDDLTCRYVTRKPKFIIKESVEREILKKRELDVRMSGMSGGLFIYIFVLDMSH